MADRLAGLSRHYSLSACVFHSGTFCRRHHYAAPHGYIHLVWHGPITARSPAYEDLLITEPSLLFYPHVASYRFVATLGNTTEQSCAEAGLDASTDNSLVMALSSTLLIPLTDLSGLGPILELLFAGAECDWCGRQVATDRLCELLLIQLLRYLMDGRLGATGLLAGPADPKLARAIATMHGALQTAWSFEALVAKMGMSRARSATASKDTVGATSGDYLADWRMNASCIPLKRGRPVVVVVDRVSYGSPSIPARASRVRMSCASRGWLTQQRGDMTSSGSWVWARLAGSWRRQHRCCVRRTDEIRITLEQLAELQVAIR